MKDITLPLVATSAEVESLRRALVERDVEVGRLRKQLDDRIEWQVNAVEHLRTWSALFDAAVAMKEGHEGCVVQPPCGDCFRCRFDKAVDEAMKATAADSPGSVMRDVALDTLRNCAVCPECGLGVRFDDDACCSTCGRDVFGFIDGQSANLLAYVEDYERVCRDANRMRPIVEAAKAWRETRGDGCAELLLLEAIDAAIAAEKERTP